MGSKGVEAGVGFAMGKTGRDVPGELMPVVLAVGLTQKVGGRDRVRLCVLIGAIAQPQNTLSLVQVQI